MTSESGFAQFARSYATEGYAVARNVVDSPIIDRAAAHVYRTIAAHQGLSFEQIHGKLLFTQDPFYLEMVTQPGMLDLARAVLGPELALFATGYIIKAPKGNSPAVLWHQDGNYWPLEPMEVCTLWMAITESTVQNGCMRVVPGTQNMGLKEHSPHSGTRALLDTQIDPSLVDESRAVDLVMAPGDVSVHHPNIIHGSNANASADRWRLNLVARIIRSTTRVTNPAWPGVFHLCGQARPDINRYLKF